MYQILAGVIVVVCFILGMNSRSISGVKEEAKIPPDPGKDGVKNSASLGAETMKSREQVRSELKLLAQTAAPSKKEDISATCYRSAPSSDVILPKPDPIQKSDDTDELPVGLETGSSAGVQLSSKNAIRAELRKLSASTPPDRNSLILHALCYKLTMPMTSAEYVCPKCKTKTPYSGIDSNTATMIAGIADVRKMISHIVSKNLDAELDETGLCSICNVGDRQGEIFILISYSGESEPVRSKVNLNDLNILTSFVDGKDTVPTSGPDSAPLKDSLKRLQEILGVTVDLK